MPPAPIQDSFSGASVCTICKACAGPPTASNTNTGVRIKAKIINVACTVSVQETAKKPPMNV